MKIGKFSKKTLALILCGGIAAMQIPLLSLASDATGLLSYGSQGEAWTLDETTGAETSANVNNTVYVSGDFESGVQFEVSHTNATGFLLMAIGNQNAVFTPGDGFYYDFCHGTGIKTMLKDGGGYDARLITAVGGWDTAKAWAGSGSGLSTTGAFNDGKWHKVAISKASGEWSIKIDGIEILTGLSDDQKATLCSYMDGNTGYVVFGVNGNNGTVKVRQTPDTGNLEYGSRTGTEWIYNAADSSYSANGFTNTFYMTADLQSGIKFQIKSSGITNDFLFMNIGNANAVFPSGDDFFYDFCHGTGLKVLLKSGGSVESKLITATGGSGWNAPAWSTNLSGVSNSGAFHDDTWHTVEISKATGTWSVKVDGTEVLTGLSTAQLNTLNSLMDSDTGYVVFSSNGYTGSVKIREVMTPAAGNLSFSSATGAEWFYSATEKAYVSEGFTNTYYMTGALETGVKFQLKSSGITNDFLFMNIGNQSAVFPAEDGFFYDFCHGTGLKVLLYNAGNVSSKLITTAGADGWNNPVWDASQSGVSSSGAFNDNTWHTVEISKASGSWSVKVDDTELLTGLSSEQQTTMNSLLDSDTGYVVFSSNGYTGTVKVQEVETSTESPANVLGAQVRGYTSGTLSGTQALRFGIQVDCAGAAYSTGYNGDLTKAVITVDGTEYAVAEMGALVARATKASADELVYAIANTSVKKIEAQKFYSIGEDSVLFTAVIRDVPETKYNDEIMARPFVRYQISEGEYGIVYGEMVQRSINGVLDSAWEA